MTAPAIVFGLCIIIAVIFLFTAIVEALGIQFVVNTIVIGGIALTILWFLIRRYA